MALHTVTPTVRKQSLAGYWRSCYHWRWNQAHPAPRGDKQWWIVASSCLATLKRKHGMDEHEIRRFITWYFCWKTFPDANPGYSETPAVLLSHRRDSDALFFLDEFRAWVEEHAYMLSEQGLSIEAVSRQLRWTTDHQTAFPAPWSAT